jgi:hypothetical protein
VSAATATSPSPSTARLDLDAVIASLTLAGISEQAEIGWLRQSAEQPTTFDQALAELVSRRVGPGARSVPGERLDLWHDLFARHATRTGAAMVWIGDDGRPEELSWSALHQRALGLASAWHVAGVKAAQRVALVLPMGPTLLVALGACARLRAVPCVLPPEGEAFVRRRLELLKADYVVYGPEHEGWAGLCDGLPLIGRGAAPLLPEVYAADAEAAVIFSTLRDPPYKPVEVLAGPLWRRAVWDGLGVYRLRPGARLGAPGFDTSELAPGVIFAALAVGATFVHLPGAAVVARPELLTRARLDHVILHPSLIETVLSLKVPLGWSGFSRDVSLPLPGARSRRLLDGGPLAEIPCTNVVLEGGGAILFSGSRQGPMALNPTALPAPGAPWMFLSPQSLKADPEEQGLFSLAKKPVWELMFARDGAEWIYAGGRVARRVARTALDEEVEAVVGALPGVVGAALVCVRALDRPRGHRQHLLIFVGDRPAQSDGLIREAQDTILAELGPGAAPDLCDVSPLFPRLVKDGAVDRAWCEAQLLTGALAHKRAHPTAAALTQLRGLLRALAVES